MPEPIVPRLPSYQKSFVDKYADIGGSLGQFPTPVRNSVYNFDLRRVQQGYQPLTKEETALALMSASQQRAITKPENPGWWERVVGDVRAITSSIPRIPVALGKEAQELPHLPGAIQEAMHAGGIGQIVGQLAQAPGIRMVPGAYTVGNLASGNAAELARHPVFTALDVIPAAHAAPVKGALAPVLERGAQLASPLTEAIGRTKVGSAVIEGFGQSSRGVARAHAQKGVYDLRDWLNSTGLSSDDLDVHLAREVGKFKDEFSDLTQDEVRSVGRIVQEQPELIRDLPDRQLAFAFRYDELRGKLGARRVEEGELGLVDGEHYDSATADSILKARRNAERTRMGATLRERVLSPTGSLDSLAEDAAGHLLKEGLGRGQVKNLALGYAHAIDAMGYDPSPLLETIRHTKFTPEGLADAFREYALKPIDSPVRAAEDVLASIEPFARRGDPIAARLKQAIESGDWKAARDRAVTIAKRKYGLPDIEEAVDSLARQNQRQKWVNKNSNFTEKAAIKEEAKAADILANNAPARFHGMINKEVESRYTAMYASHPDFDKLVQNIGERNYDLLPGWEKGEHANLVKEVERTWVDMKATGADPIFVHRVSPGAAQRLRFPSASEIMQSVTQVKKRTFDLTPAVDDITVSLSHQAAEVLARKATENFVGAIVGEFDEATGKYVGGWGRTERDLLEEYLPAAREAFNREPALSVRSHAAELIKRDWKKLDPDRFVPWSAPKLGLSSGEGVLVPKHIYNVMQRLHEPPAGRLTTLLDPVMKVYRTSLLPLSPRWHTYNIIGGAVMLMGRTDPFTVWKYAKDAREMIANGELPRELALGRGMGSAPREAIEWNYRAGGTLRRWWDESQAGKALKPLTEKGGKFIEKSYDINAWFDDTYRVMSYLYGEDKALVKGLSKDASIEQGLQLSRKVMMDWDGMTPIERSIIRNVFPFYGWMRHVMKYTLSYPWDHPLRASIMAGFARNELADMGDGLPYSMLNALKLGDMDANGHVKMFKFGGMNPFGDFADYFTLAGFTKSLGPIGGTILQTVGVDPMGAAPELYPQVSYDASTGQLAPSGGNIFTNFAKNILPQSELLLGMVQRKSQFNQMLRNNPASAGRMMTSALGLPTPYRDIDMPAEYAKQELKRHEVEDTVKGEALRSGDFSRAKNFPGLKAMFDQIDTLQGQGKLKEFEPQSEGSSLIAAAQRALAGRL